jgi:hypothetical protein
MLLLFAPDDLHGPVPGSRGATGTVGVKFLPQPGLQLHRMQFAERRKTRRRFPPLALPRGHLNAAELAACLRALDDLASGKLRPSLP